MALSEFQLASASAPLPAFTYNIAVIQEKLGRYQAALESYRNYLADIGPQNPENREIQSRILRLEGILWIEKNPSAPPPPNRALQLRNAAIAVAPPSLALNIIGTALILSGREKHKSLVAECKNHCDQKILKGLTNRENAGWGLLAAGLATAVADTVLWHFAVVGHYNGKPVLVFPTANGLTASGAF